MVRYKILITFIFASLLSFSATPQEGSIKGIVTEKDNSVRIEGARVTDQSGNTLAVSGPGG
jgi:hypothetical protein